MRITFESPPGRVCFSGSAQESEQVVDWRGFANGEVFRTL